MNEHQIYEPEGQYIDILFRQRKIFLENYQRHMTKRLKGEANR